MKTDVLLESFMGEVTILSDAFERKDASLEDPDCIEGLLTGQSKGLKRPTFYREGGHSGIFLLCSKEFCFHLLDDEN